MSVWLDLVLVPLPYYTTFPRILRAARSTSPMSMQSGASAWSSAADARACRPRGCPGASRGPSQAQCQPSSRRTSTSRDSWQMTSCPPTALHSGGGETSRRKRAIAQRGGKKRCRSKQSRRCSGLPGAPGCLRAALSSSPTVDRDWASGMVMAGPRVWNFALGLSCAAVGRPATSGVTQEMNTKVSRCTDGAPLRPSTR